MDFDKKKFINMFYDAYINKYINTNIYCHIEFFKTLKDISQKKKESDILSGYENMKKIFLHNEFIIPEIKKIDVRPEYIDTILYTFNEEYPVLNKMKANFTERVYSLLNYIYGCILRQENIDNVLMCVTYLLDLKNKEIGKVGNICMMDVLFNLIVYLSKMIDKDVYKYVLISRELMYFKSNKKILRDRIRLLYITIYVVICSAVDKTKLVISKKHERCDYLFVLCEKDYRTKIDIDRACQALKTRRQELKNVKMGNYNPNEPDVNIVKICV